VPKNGRSPLPTIELQATVDMGLLHARSSVCTFCALGVFPVFDWPPSIASKGEDHEAIRA